MPTSSFEAKFKFDGEEMHVSSCNYSLSQSIDDQGRVSSRIYGGTVFVQIDSSDNSKLWEWMIDQDGKKDCSIEFVNIDSESVLKKLEMKDAYCVQYSESFADSGSHPMSTSLTLSAREIQLDGKPHRNRW
ncbi:type VI secretion system tube protein TssD [Larkinella soli]|uniref:type VI secretion system tube protein TssD n=1 Tax=Larkinella soli TaxID=1770527 RepID=UPI000FFBE6AC|nr:type VI secretion system tube protein TssD [Larkinella soli]